MPRKHPVRPILLVDDEPDLLESVRMVLAASGLNHAVAVADPVAACGLLAEQAFEVAVIDMMMPSMSGQELLGVIGERAPELPVIVLTAMDDVDTAVGAMQGGAFDYLVKPVDDTRLVTSIERAMRHRGIEAENAALKASLTDPELAMPEAFNSIVTAAPSMLSIFRYLEAVAPSAMPILITGETGTGKELIAQAIHDVSGREGKLVEVNIAGVDDNMLSDTLFGHKRGAFTGADSSRAGLIEQAAGGTLLLDEIGDLSPASQVKLLRLLQDGRYFPVGSDVPRRSDARVIAATNQDLTALRDSGTFRGDLYFRLQTHHVRLPPLRERREDLSLLLDHFLEKAAESLGRRMPTAPPELVTVLKNYAWPGNIRELEGMVFDAVSRHAGGVLSMQVFLEKSGLNSPAALGADSGTDSERVAFGETLPTLKEAEQRLIDEALARADGSQTMAARLLGISRQALNNRLRRERSS